MPKQVTIGPVSREGLACGPELVALPRLASVRIGICISEDAVNAIQYVLKVLGWLLPSCLVLHACFHTAGCLAGRMVLHGPSWRLPSKGPTPSSPAFLPAAVLVFAANA